MSNEIKRVQVVGETYEADSGSHIKTSDLQAESIQAAIDALSVSAKLHWADSENPSLSDPTRNHAAECAVSARQHIAYFESLLEVAKK